MIADPALGADVFNLPDVDAKMRILHAIDKPLDHMSVAEICRNANLSRQAFYRNFASKYDIPLWYTVFCRQFYLDEIGRTIAWRTGYFHHVRLLAREREVLRRCSPHLSTFFDKSAAVRHRKAVLLDTLEHHRQVSIDDNLRFMVGAFAKMECEVLDCLLCSCEPVDLARWADDLVSLVPPRLFGLLDVDEPFAVSAPLR